MIKRPFADKFFKAVLVIYPQGLLSTSERTNILNRSCCAQEIPHYYEVVLFSDDVFPAKSSEGCER